jgi:L-threonylcarbamoyladenylate synthase
MTSTANPHGGPLTEIVPADTDGIQRAVSVLLLGGIVAIPTETVYGLAADAFNVDAVAKIFVAKERPTFDPLIVHVSTALASVDALCEAEIADLKGFSLEEKTLCERLIAEFWPGPLTLVLPKHHKIPDLVTAGLPHVGVRMPAHRAAKRILLDSKRPLAAPSANRFGRISPTTAEHVFAELEGRIPLIVDGGAAAVGVESTVIQVRDRHIDVLRPGGISIEDIRRVAGSAVTVERVAGITGTGAGLAMLAPGCVASHYAPAKPVILWKKSLGSVSEKLQQFVERDQQIGVLFINGKDGDRLFEVPQSMRKYISSKSLSQSGNPVEVARNLFATLRALDESDVQVIFAEAPSETTGLWYAIGDRLSRAGSKK